jgi:hypothetical protein
LQYKKLQNKSDLGKEKEAKVFTLNPPTYQESPTGEDGDNICRCDKRIQEKKRKMEPPDPSGQLPTEKDGGKQQVTKFIYLYYIFKSICNKQILAN